MQIGIYAPTHGLGLRDRDNFIGQHVEPTVMQPVEVARRAEGAGFHSMWFPDHVCMPYASESGHVANESRTRAYQPRHNMLDAAVVMGAVACATRTLRLGTSVLIAPYRGPLNDARQFATIDVLSGGRLVLGVGAGWMAEEFEALGLSYEARGPMTEECIEIYKRCWTEDVVSFAGSHYAFENLSMDPKPAQRPRPPILFGSVVPAGARRAARLCDGLYPIFLDPGADPFRFSALQDIVRSELDGLGRDPGSFHMIAAASMHISEKPDESGPDRAICTGTPEQVLGDLERFAAAGYSLVIAFYDCPSGTSEELFDQIERTGAEIVPAASTFDAAGGWKPLP